MLSGRRYGNLWQKEAKCFPLFIPSVWCFGILLVTFCVAIFESITSQKSSWPPYRVLKLQKVRNTEHLGSMPECLWLQIMLHLISWEFETSGQFLYVLWSTEILTEWGEAKHLTGNNNCKCCETSPRGTFYLAGKSGQIHATPDRLICKHLLVTGEAFAQTYMFSYYLNHANERQVICPMYIIYTSKKTAHPYYVQIHMEHSKKYCTY